MGIASGRCGVVPWRLLVGVSRGWRRVLGIAAGVSRGWRCAIGIAAGRVARAGAVPWRLLVGVSRGWRRVLGIADQGVVWVAQCLRDC